MYASLTFDKYYRLLIASQEGEIDNISVVAIMTGQTVEYWKQSTDRKLFDSLVSQINTNLNMLNNGVPEFIMGVEMPKDLGFVACGVYEDAKEVAKKITEAQGFDRFLYYPELIAGYVQWREDGNYDSLLAKKVEENVWKANASDVIGACNFFLENLSGLKPGTLTGLQNPIMKERKLMQGIKHFMKRLGL